MGAGRPLRDSGTPASPCLPFSAVRRGHGKRLRPLGFAAGRHNMFSLRETTSVGREIRLYKSSVSDREWERLRDRPRANDFSGQRTRGACRVMEPDQQVSGRWGEESASR